MAVEVQRRDSIDNLERSEITKKVNAPEEELRSMSRVRGWDNRTENELM